MSKLPTQNKDYYKGRIIEMPNQKDKTTDNQKDLNFLLEEFMKFLKIRKIKKVLVKKWVGRPYKSVYLDI